MATFAPEPTPLIAVDDPRPQPWAVLFDIDGTLIDSGGAGGSALLAALQHEFGVEQPEPVRLHGRTDAGIIAELLERNRVPPTPAHQLRLCERYYAFLPSELDRRGGKILPGVVPLLEQLRGVAGCHVGLLTGNMPRSARLKLEHFGLWEWFEFGIFGDQAVHRAELAAPTRRAVGLRSGQELAGKRMIVIGDTPLDVELALALEARCLAVSTGGFAAASLLAAGACRAVEDLSRTADILEWIFQQTELE